MAPATLGTFLRSFSFGQVRQLDRDAARCASCKSCSLGCVALAATA
jgi:hypothetical protein